MILFRWLISAVAVYFTAWLLPGIAIPDWGTAFLVAAVLGLVNVLVKPFLVILSLPLIALTLGLFLLVINAVTLMFVGELIPSFVVTGIWPAIWGSIIISVVTMVLTPPTTTTEV